MHGCDNARQTSFQMDLLIGEPGGRSVLSALVTMSKSKRDKNLELCAETIKMSSIICKKCQVVMIISF